MGPKASPATTTYWPGLCAQRFTQDHPLAAAGPLKRAASHDHLRAPRELRQRDPLRGLRGREGHATSPCGALVDAGKVD